MDGCRCRRTCGAWGWPVSEAREVTDLLAQATAKDHEIACIISAPIDADVRFRGVLALVVSLRRLEEIANSQRDMIDRMLRGGR